MITKIVSWIKSNYEKVVFLAFALLLVVVASRLFFGSNKEEELQSFANEIKPPAEKPLKIEPIYNKDLGAYLAGNSFSYYEPIQDRAVFFPPAPKKVVVELPTEMNLKCTRIISAGGIFTAVLRDEKTGTDYTVKIGSRVEDFMVESINRDGVILSGQNKLIQPIPKF